MRTSLRAFDSSGGFLGAVTCSESSSRKERTEELKEAFSEEGFELLVHRWAVDDKFFEDKSGEVTMVTQEEAVELRMLDPGERIFYFNKGADPEKQEKYGVFESEMNEEEVNVLMSDFINRWNFLPPVVQGKFMNYFLDSMEEKGIDPRNIGTSTDTPERVMGVKVTQEWVKTPNAEGEEQFTSNGWFDPDGDIVPEDFEEYSAIIYSAVDEHMNPVEGNWTLPMSKYIELIKKKKSNESSSN